MHRSVGTYGITAGAIRPMLRLVFGFLREYLEQYEEKGNYPTNGNSCKASIVVEIVMCKSVRRIVRNNFT